MNNKIILEINLLNKTFVNEEIIALKSEEIFLQNFNIFGGNIQCLKAAHLTLNGLESDCEALQVFRWLRPSLYEAQTGRPTC